jgi:predicted flap endonuclease-1-like 5' DNA nuclease
MTFVAGVLWWIVLGALLGWVGAWWLGRSTQRLLTEPVIQFVERPVDNPQHLARIEALEAETQRIAELEAEVARIAALEAQAATVPTLQARIDELLAAPPRVVEKVVTRTIEKPVDRIVEKIVDRPVDRIVERVVERPVPDLAALAARDETLRAQRQRIEHLDALAAVLSGRVAAAAAQPPQPAAATPAPADTDAALRPLRARIEHLEALAAVQAERLTEAREAARAAIAGFAAADADDTDIEVVEGIGPKIAELLRARGLGTFDALAQASPGTLREILDDSGPAYRIADPTTWPEQARLAADGRWDELKSLQHALVAGRR